MELNKDHFEFKSGVFCGEPATLIVPAHSDDGWTTENLGYRSVILDEYENIVSRGWPKFFNYGQKPELYPNPFDFNDWVIEEKIDGSLAIVTMRGMELSIRTRGTFSYETLENASDFKQLEVKYPMAKQLAAQNRGWSFLFEIVTPNQKIVINYPEIDFYFIGMVHNHTGRMADAVLLDSIADAFKLKRPKKYSFDNFDDLVRIVKEWRDREGVVVSYNKGQNRIKFKADHYCFLHKIISGYRSQSEIIDKFFELGKPNFDEFFAYYEKEIDYEFAKEIEGELKKIVICYRVILEKIILIKGVVDKIRTGFSRKEQAEVINEHWKDWRCGVAFNLLDNKPIDDKVLKKLTKEGLVGKN